jgi:hypothetical protein
MKSLGSVVTWTTIAVLAVAACGGGDDDGASADAGGNGPNHVADPMPAAGGGVGSGAINGELNVFALDARSKQPIAGASVHVIRSGGAATLSATTDAAGLTTFTDASLAGAQTISVAAAGHVPATWYGANGAVVTITLDPTAAAPAPATATVSGSMTLTRPTSANHVSIALVQYSLTKDLGAPENQIVQPEGPNANVPANACVVTLISSTTCSWSLVTRTGKQTLYAFIVDLDTKGTSDSADDVITLVGYAAHGGLDLAADQTVTNQPLETVAAADIAMLNVTFPASAPATLGTLSAIPILEMGDERLVFPFPTITLAAPTARLPKTTGVFASGQWTLIAQAKTSAKIEDPQATIFKHAFDPAATLTLGEFPALPSNLTAAATTFSFTPVTGASVHTAEIDDEGGKPLWKAVILDATHELSLSTPDVLPTALPAGNLRFKVGSATVSGWNPADFEIDTDVTTDHIDTLSSQVKAFTN